MLDGEIASELSCFCHPSGNWAAVQAVNLLSVDLFLLLLSVPLKPSDNPK